MVFYLSTGVLQFLGSLGEGRRSAGEKFVAKRCLSSLHFNLRNLQWLRKERNKLLSYI